MSASVSDRGVPVIVRTCGERPAVRFIWEARGAGFIVTERPGDNTFAVGIPERDVFVFDQETADAIKRGDPLSWERLTPLRS